MDVVEITVLAVPGKPAAVGHLGTVVLGPTNDAGETLVKFTLSRKLARKWLPRHRPKRFDNHGPEAQNESNN